MSEVNVTVTPQPPIEVEIEEQDQIVVVPVEVPPEIIQIESLGSDAYYAHTANNPTTSEPVNHGLGKFPAVTAINSAGDEVEAGVNHIDEDNVVCTFSFPFSGKIYFN